jgi:hypothetical protein
MLTIQEMKIQIPLIVAALSATFITSPQRSIAAADINGEVFIVMKAGNSIKLGLVEVGLHKTEDVAEKIAEVTQRAPAILTDALSKRDQAKDAAAKAVKFRRDAELTKKNLWDYITANLPMDLKIGMLEVIVKGTPLEEIMKTSASPQSKIETLKTEAHRLDGFIADAIVADEAAAAASARAQDELDVAKSMRFVVQALPAPIQMSTSNADGKFSFNAIPNGNYILAATTSREVGDRPEFFAWCVPLETKQAGIVSVMLSNHNLLAAE